MGNEPVVSEYIDDDSEHDEDIRRAIALSLQMVSAPKDDTGAEDEDLRRAIDLSLEQSKSEDGTQTADHAQRARSSALNPDKGVSSGNFLLDRKQMEDERLARLKRKAADTGSIDRPTQKARVATTIRPAAGLINRPDAQGTNPTYLDGVVKRTWAKGHDRHEDIKIEEVLQKNDLELAVLSSYIWDDEWLLSKFDLRKTKILLIAYASSETKVRDPIALESGNACERTGSDYQILFSSNGSCERHAFEATDTKVQVISSTRYSHRESYTARLGRVGTAGKRKQMKTTS
jgi:hypothetical protein